MSNFIYPLIEDLSEKVIRESISKTREQNFREYILYRQKLKDFYDGHQTTQEYLFRWGFLDAESNTIMKDLPGIGTKLTKRVIDRISLVYKNPPQRKLIGKDDKEIKNDTYAEFISENKSFNTWLKNGERLHNLMHNVLLRPAWLSKLGKWRFYIETDYIAYFTEYDKLNPVAYDIPIKHDVSDKGNVENQKYIFISKDDYFIHDENGKQELVGDLKDFKNPYGRIPLIDLTDFAIDEYWNLGAKDLVEANQMLNIMILNGMYAFHFESFDQPWVQSSDKEKVGKIQVGSNSIAVIPPETNTGLWSYDINFAGMKDWLNWFNATVLSNYGLKAHFEEQGQIPSGIALKINNLELLENRQEDVDRFRIIEDEVLEVIRAMTDLHKESKIKIPKDAKVSVDYAEVEFPKTDQEIRDDEIYRIEQGYATKIDILMERNPDLSRDEAKEEYQRIQDESAEIGGGVKSKNLENEFRRILEE